MCLIAMDSFLQVLGEILTKSLFLCSDSFELLFVVMTQFCKLINDPST